MKIGKDKSKPEKTAFWRSLDEAAEEVRRWPSWLRGEAAATDSKNKTQKTIKTKSKTTAD